ncbi:hypothetical protein JD844_026925 [Phrynosoma platyrhinos]|uniref:Helicase C-terminal domain-containing protein n=1 Tax=Phrynosoma platyrhinos TaxID=52577 RepID=A0ABQ7SFP9_PHRPL|nr:hypothetical protein JD844_026925 [Phrynosoma platyrhinos]
MVNVWKKWPRADELDPEKFTCFKDNPVIRKADARYYEQELKDELELWIEGGHKQKAAEVLKLLKPHGESCSENQMKEIFPHFVEKLQEMDKLPALFFIFNIKIAEELAKKVCCFLEKKEMLLREEEVPGSKNQGHLLPKKTEPADKLKETKQTSIMQTSGEDDELLIKKVEPGNVGKQLEQISGKCADCTYANYQALDMEALCKILNHARFITNYEELRELALRGIGYHHAFMEFKERQLVEMLFKMGFIQVLTSTGTLALGINTPCKSVVFVQNSEFLDALAYRWMSGRTGQRGHHSVGNVYFYNIPFSKIESFMKSKTLHIQGQFLLRASLILRLMLFASKADDKTNARKRVMSLLKNSLLSFEEPWTLKMLKLYFVFSLQFLVKEARGLFNSLCLLIQKGMIETDRNFLIQTGTKVFSEEVMEKLVVVLAHLFGRKYMPAAVVGSKQKFSRSKVFLEELSEDFTAALDKYNHKVEESFGQFLLTVSTVANNRKRYQLPLSKLDFSNKQQYDHPLAFQTMKCDMERTAISPFVCLSGNSDLDLLHAGSLNNVLLHMLGITVSNIPVLYLKKCDNQGRRMPLNAYLLDFYRHGSLKAICQDNGLHEREACDLLKDFAHTVQTISISLREFCRSEDRNVVWAFEQLAKSYWKKLEEIKEEGENNF